MKITRHTQQELVAQDSTMWLSMFFALASVPMIYVSIMAGRPKQLLAAGLVVLFSLLSRIKTTFVFDATQRTVRWSGLKFVKTKSGTIPFDAITGVGTELINIDSGPSYRLTILTRTGSIPMTYGYRGDSERLESIRETILAFVKPDQHNTAILDTVASGSAAAENDPSLRSLLAQRRKIDAITLVRTREGLGLTQAVRRVEAVEKKMKAGG